MGGGLVTGPGPVPMSTGESECAYMSVCVCVCCKGGGKGGEGRVVSQQLSYIDCEKTKMSCHCNSQDALLFSIAATAAAA